MNVDYPTNANDEEITTTIEDAGKKDSLNALTSMTFSVYRIRLADLCRDAVDSISSAAPPESVSQEIARVVKVDRKFRVLLEEATTLFKGYLSNLDRQNQPHSSSIFELACLGLYASIYLRLCHLHRSYCQRKSKRRSTDYFYLQSRFACLQSAEQVIEIYNKMNRIHHSLKMHPPRIWVHMQHVFFAATTLAYDMAYNPFDEMNNTRCEIKVNSACQLVRRLGDKSSGGGGGFAAEAQKKLGIISTILKERNYLLDSMSLGSSVLTPVPCLESTGKRASINLGSVLMPINQHLDLAEQASSTFASSARINSNNIGYESEDADASQSAQFLDLEPELDSELDLSSFDYSLGLSLFGEQSASLLQNSPTYFLQ